VSVDLQHVPSGEYWDKVTVGYAGGEICDVIYLPPNNCQDLGAKGVLIDLTPQVQADKFNLDDITPTTQQPYMWGGKIYAINAMNDTSFIVYNVDMFERAGLPTDLPKEWDGSFTLDQFVEYAKKLTNPSKQEWGFVIPANDFHSVFMLGGKLWDDDKYPTKSALDTAQSINGLQFMRDLVYKHKVAPGPAEMSGMGGSDDIFKTGKVGIVFARNKNLTGIFKPVKFKYRATTFPKDPAFERRTDIGINGFGTQNKSKVQDAAWKYIKWMTADEGNALLLGLTSLPANKNVDPYKVSPLEKWEVKLTYDGLPKAWLSSPHPNVRRQMFTEINQELEQLMLDKKSAEDAGKAAADRVNKIFKDLGPAVPR
jgi:ABC-type glycerol-3-phosphate transport system substrate-binding protein